MNLKKNGKVLTSKSVGTGTSSYEKRIYRAVVSNRLRNTGLRLLGMNPRIRSRLTRSLDIVQTKVRAI